MSVFNLAQTSNVEEQAAKDICALLTAKITAPTYPCIGAKSSFARNLSTLFVVNDLLSETELSAALHRLYKFLEEAKRSKEMFHSFILASAKPLTINDDEFEILLWSSLQILHDLDKKKFEWCQDVSSDPASSEFSMSLGEEAFFVIGMHAQAGRKVRAFPYPVLIFNRHAQFEALRRSGQFGRLRNMIRARDEVYSGSANPLLDDYGNSSEARQYSGKPVGEGWRCPFHAN